MIMNGLSRIDPLIEQGNVVEQVNVKLAKSIVSTLTAQRNQINYSFKIRNTLYNDVSKESVPTTVSFSFNLDNFPPLTNVGRTDFKSGNSSNISLLEVSLFRLMSVKL